jgi:hypothetical protein
MPWELYLADGTVSFDGSFAAKFAVPVGHADVGSYGTCNNTSDYLNVYINSRLVLYSISPIYLSFSFVSSSCLCVRIISNWNANFFSMALMVGLSVDLFSLSNCFSG